ncbi:MAG: hypothetical protein ACC628_24730, partial [Pirellulaceae bacterium]
MARSANVLYAQPVRPRKSPPRLPDIADMPGPEKDNPMIRFGLFQVLDQHYRAVHTMRSRVSARPGEHRGRTGCHEGHNATPAVQPVAVGTTPDILQAPPSLVVVCEGHSTDLRSRVF